MGLLCLYPGPALHVTDGLINERNGNARIQVDTEKRKRKRMVCFGAWVIGFLKDDCFPFFCLFILLCTYLIVVIRPLVECE